jgi:hypothetical protein
MAGRGGRWLIGEEEGGTACSSGAGAVSTEAHEGGYEGVGGKTGLAASSRTRA